MNGPNVLTPEILAALEAADLIYLTTHVNPDGDAIGSELALWRALVKLGKTVRIVNADPAPASLRFLPHQEALKLFEEGLPPPAILITVEVPDPKRMGKVQSVMKAAKHVLNVDHHPTNTRYGTWNVMDEQAAALGEMAHRMIRQWEAWKGVSLMDHEIAACLYAAILTDTGRFGYSSTTPATHALAGELLGFGLEPYEFVRHLYETSSRGRLALLAKSLATLGVSPDGQVAWMAATHDMFQETGTTSEETEGFVDYPRSIPGVEVALFLRENDPGVVKVSLRAVGDVKVNAVAQQFGGGGHDKAAGCQIRGTMADAQRRVLEALQQRLKVKNG